jgi:hypothetical protein
VHELAAHDVASPNRLDARRRAESRLHRGARARRLCVDAVWGSDFLNARLRSEVLTRRNQQNLRSA